MATSTTQRPKKPGKKPRNVLQMEPSGDLQIPPDSPEFPAEPEPEASTQGAVPLGPFPTPPRSKFKGGDCDPDEGIAYWRAIPKEFYPRLIVYVNREKPVLNRLQELSPEELFLVRSGKKRAPFKYIDKTIEPWPGETRMEYLNRYGSGICRLYINDAGAPGHRSEKDFKSRTLCKFTLSYYDSEFPTVLDPSRADKGLGILELNHPENQSYIADLRMKGILPAEPRTGDDMGDSVVKTLVDKVGELSDRVQVHEQDRLVERIVERVGNGNNNGQSRASELVDTFKAVKELLPQPAAAAAPAPAAPAVDPLAQAVSLATTIMQMKTDNPMMDLYRDEMKALREELKEAHKEMRAMQTAQAPAAAPKDLVTQIVELATDEKKLEPITKLFRLFGGGGNGDAPARSSRTSGLDIVREFISSPMGANLGSMLGQGAIMLMSRAPAQPMNGHAINPPRPVLIPPQAQPAPAAAPNGEGFEQRITRIGQTITEPMLYQFFLKDKMGDEFAAFMDGMWPEDFAFLKELGADAIVKLYQQSPAWTLIAPRAPAFTEFIQELCMYDPNEDEGPTAPGNGDDGIVDLTTQEPN